MAIHRSLQRHTVSRRQAQLRQCPARSLTSRPDFLGMVGGKRRRSPSSQLLDAIKPAPSPQDALSSISSIFSVPSSPPSSAHRSSSPTLRNSFDVLSSMAQRMPTTRPSIADTLLSRSEAARKSRAIERSVQRQWRAGDVYAPHDLSPEEGQKYRKSRPPSADIFDVLNINPLDEYKNLPLMMDFVSPLGRLKHQRETGLRPVNQRKVSRAVRRASALGLLPRTHAHPEMLRRPGPWQRK